MLMKSTDTVVMALGRKGLTSGVIKGLTVCWLAVCVLLFCLCVLYCVSTLLCIALLCRAIQTSVLVLTGEICIVYI
ncbi:unnamed protein product, partial [Staurois parvus]